MDYSTLKEKYEKKLDRLNTKIEDYKNSNNIELRIAVSTFEKEEEETELLLKAINEQLHLNKDTLEGNFIKEKCLKCGATLLGNKVRDKWCSNIECDYGLR